MDAELRKHCQRRKAAMIEEREPWMTDWRQVSEYIDPTRGRFDEGEDRKNAAKRSRAKIINNTATRALRVMSAGMMSHMTSKSRPWFRLTTPDPALAERADVRLWLDREAQGIRDTLAKSNFYKAMPVFYTEDGMYGIAAMLQLENATEVIRFHPLTVGSYAVGLDDEGRVDSLWRCYKKTARQLVQRYGLVGEDGKRKPDPSKMPTALVQAFANNPDQTFTVEALIEPNPDAKPGMGPLGLQAPKFRPYREVVWIQGAATDGHGCLDIGGHYEAPFVSARWNPVGDDVYSTCPGIDSLGDIKQLQYLEGKKLKQIDLLSEPPLSLPDSMRGKSASLNPGAKTYLPRSEHGAKAEVLYQPHYGAVQATAAEIREVESRLEAAFFYSLFLMLDALDDRDRTATEIAERKEEKATVLGPTVEAISDEVLDHVVVRTFRLRERAGLVTPAPQVLANVPLKIEYTSILAQAAKAYGLSSIERTIGFAGQMAQAFGPQVLDKIDVDQAIDEYADRQGSPASIVRSDDNVAAIREGRAQQERMQQAAAMAKPLADAATAMKTMGETVNADGSLAQGMADAMGAG